MALVAVVVAAAPLPTKTAEAAPAPKVVLDPDDNYSFVDRDGQHITELPITYDIAVKVKAKLPSVCAADVVITRGTSPDFVSRAARAAQMQDAAVSVTLSLNSLFGVPWGSEIDGGTAAFATGASKNFAFAQDTTAQFGAFTGRPTYPVNGGPTNGTVYPYAEYAGLPGTYSQVFMLNIDHVYDYEVIRTGRDLMVDALVTALAHSLQAQGYPCLGSFPGLPSAARLRQLRNLGYQQYLRYAAEPVSMSTGNFSTAEELFTLPGVGDQAIDLTLNYNAQSGIDSPVGVGWQFAYGAHLQQYNDGSVVVVLPDGRGLLYSPNGNGDFTSPAGSFAQLTQPDNTTFVWRTATGSTLRFQQNGAGRGALVATEDRQGNRETLTYNGEGNLFPRLASITDESGQTVNVATNADGRITSVTRPGGSTWQLSYSAAGDLAAVTSPRGTTRQHVYDSDHRVTAQIGQDGQTFLTNTFDAQSRVIKQTNAFGDVRTLVFDDVNRVTTYTDANGATARYFWDALGQITKVEDPSGGTELTAYNTELLPASMTDPLGKTSERQYDPSGQVSSAKDELGHVVTSSYNGDGDLTARADNDGARAFAFVTNSDGRPTRTTNPDGTELNRTYDSHGDLTAQTNELGATRTFDYDGRGNVLRVTDELGRKTTMQYDVANRVTSVTDPRGGTTSFSYDGNDNLLVTGYPNGSTETRTYDVNDQPQKVTDRRGGVTTYGYDAELNTVSITAPNGGVTTNSFDNENRLMSTIDALGNTTSYSRDALGRVTTETDARGHAKTTSYDLAGRVKEITDPAGGKTAYARDAVGQELTVTDPDGGVTANEWDAVGRLRRTIDERGNATAYVYNFRDQVRTETNPAGGVVANEYDKTGRLIQRTDQQGAVTKFEYNPVGELIKEVDARGDVTTYAYDAAGNRTSATDANGHVTTWTYDSMNQVVSETNGRGKITQFARDAGSLLTKQTDPLGHVRTFSFDISGDRTAAADPLGRRTFYAYDLDRRLAQETAADGVKTAYQYDGVDNLTAVTRNVAPGQPASASTNVTTRYSYDPRNLLTSATDPNGGIRTYTYNARGLKTEDKDPLGRATTYAYDPAGNLAKRTKPDGVVTDSTYNSRDLLASRDYSTGKHETFEYDAVGRQTKAWNEAGTVATTYDALGRRTRVVDANGRALKYGYDSVGNRTRMTLPDGRNVNYSYSESDRLSVLGSPLGTVQVAYDSDDRPTELTRPNGTRTGISFDEADQTRALVTTAKDGSQSASFKYTYDAVGNTSSKAERIGKGTATAKYAYDPLRRLLESSGGSLASKYTYDAAGNRLSWSTPNDPMTSSPRDAMLQLNNYDAAGQLVTSTKIRRPGNATFTHRTDNTYDSNGNRRFSGTIVDPAKGQSAGTAYYYDEENRLAARHPAGDRPSRGNGNGQRDYKRTYDALGRLISEVAGKNRTAWTSDGFDPIASHTPDATTFYLRDAQGALLGERTNGADAAWYLTDALGSIFGATGSTGKVNSTTSYADYGLNLETSAFRAGFSGELADSLRPPGDGIGNDTPTLSHFYARSYEAMTASWLQADPLTPSTTRPESFNAYQFVEGNPTTNKDLLGYLSVCTNCGYTGALTVSNSSGSWNGGSLQANSSSAQILHPTVSPQVTVDGRYLQNTYNPFSGYGRRSCAAYGSCVSSAADISGTDLQGSNSLRGTIGTPNSAPGCSPYSDSLITTYLSGRIAAPCGFTSRLGYTPVVGSTPSGTRAFDPGGSCSAPLVGSSGRSFDFLNPCKTHDYGYDLLRFRSTLPEYQGTSPVSVRLQIDSLLGSDAHATCRDRGTFTKYNCFIWAQTFEDAVKSNTRREDWFGDGYPRM